MRKTASIMLGSVLILLTLGIVMLASTSSVRAQMLVGDSLFYLKRQVVWLFLGGTAGIIAARIDYTFWKKAAVPIAVFCVILLVMTLIPNVGVSIKGSRRWLRFGAVSLQASEFAKPATIMLLAWWLSKTRWHIKEFKRGLVIPMACLGTILLLIFVEPDFGTTLLVAVVGMAMMYAAGTRFVYLLVTALVGLSGFLFAIMHNAERMRRIIAFLNPEKYAQDEAFQLMNAVYAFMVGGAFGEGLGESLQKRFYLPEAHTDFIFAIMGEELGLAATLLVVLLFAVLFVCGIRIALHAPDDFGKLMAFGMCLMITMQACINVGVVTGCLPTKGLPLPFISFGGSSMVVNLLMIGILVNISRHALEDKDLAKKAIRDRRHRF
jgi:cell division protein FtsW